MDGYFEKNNLVKGKSKRDANGIQNLKIYFAAVSKEGTFSTIKELSVNSRTYSVGHPTISPDGKYLFFVNPYCISGIERKQYNIKIVFNRNS